MPEIADITPTKILPSPTDAKSRSPFRFIEGILAEGIAVFPTPPWGGGMRTADAVGEFLQSCNARNLSPVTVEWYRSKLSRFAQEHPKLPKRPTDIEGFLASISGAAETKHAYFAALRSLYSFASDRYSFANPMRKVGAPRCPPKIMATLEPDETFRLLNSAANNPRDLALLTLLIDTGIRAGEATSLRRQDIKTDTIQVTGKSGQREVPISEETRQLLLALLAEGADEHVFRGYGKRPLSRDGVYRIVRHHMEKAGIPGPKLGPHRCRHAFGKGWIVSGGDVRSLQVIMGHSDITTTQKYASLADRDLVNKHHRHTPLRAAHAAAQERLFEPSEAVREAEEIVTKKAARGESTL